MEASEDDGAKWSEYAVLNISKYWIADAIVGQVTVVELVHGRYHDRSFQGDDAMLSPTFPDLKLTVNQVLNAG